MPPDFSEHRRATLPANTTLKTLLFPTGTEESPHAMLQTTVADHSSSRWCRAQIQFAQKNLKSKSFKSKARHIEKNKRKQLKNH